ncbi:MAG: hypothetical protein H7831_06595 [Magnetococcus sp. WYHC-3]|jgi:hypothetical protein
MFHMLIGVDYSITCPCLCLYDERKPFKFDNCFFYYLTNTKKYADKILPNITGESFQEYVQDVDRFDTISDWAINLCIGASDVAVEGYSYGSKGKVFNLAENMGIFKHKLYKAAVPLTIIEPSKAKKMATGKGNADKALMYESFSKETNTNLLLAFDQKTLSNPVTDIVDSFYILKALIQSKGDLQG